MSVISICVSALRVCEGVQAFPGLKNVSVSWEWNKLFHTCSGPINRRLVVWGELCPSPQGRETTLLPSLQSAALVRCHLIGWPRPRAQCLTHPWCFPVTSQAVFPRRVP